MKPILPHVTAEGLRPFVKSIRVYYEVAYIQRITVTFHVPYRYYDYALFTKSRLIERQSDSEETEAAVMLLCAELANDINGVLTFMQFMDITLKGSLTGLFEEFLNGTNPPTPLQAAEYINDLFNVNAYSVETPNMLQVRLNAGLHERKVKDNEPF